MPRSGRRSLIRRNPALQYLMDGKWWVGARQLLSSRWVRLEPDGPLPQGKVYAMTKTMKLTKEAIAAFSFAINNKQFIYRDTEIRGFKLKVGRARKTLILEKRVQGKKGSAKTFKLGTFPIISVKEARRLALEYSALCERGTDPFEKRQSKKDDEYRPVTFIEMMEAYFKTENLKSDFRERSLIKRHMEDWFEKDMRTLTVDELVERYKKIKEKAPTMGGAMLQLFSAAWNSGVS